MSAAENLVYGSPKYLRWQVCFQWVHGAYLLFYLLIIARVAVADRTLRGLAFPVLGVLVVSVPGDA